MTVNEAAELSAEELAGVAGGMTCEQGFTVAHFYRALGDVYGALGIYTTSASSYAFATGVLTGACD